MRKIKIGFIAYLVSEVVLLGTLFSGFAKAGLLPVGIYFGPIAGIGFNSGSAKSSEPTKELGQTGTVSAINMKNSFYAGLLAGIRFLDFRMDIEYGFRSVLAKPVVNGKELYSVNGHNLFANLYYDVLDLTILRLYVNGGLGKVSFVKKFTSKINSSFAWSAGLGLNFSLLDFVNMDVGYRYVHMGKLKIDRMAVNQKVNDIYGVLRFGF
jgi:opacity protein-like surface antigen